MVTLLHKLVDIIQPVNNIEKNKCDGKDHSGPLVYRVNISQIRDFDFDLGCPSS